jgi:hypothetical protein
MAGALSASQPPSGNVSWAPARPRFGTGEVPRRAVGSAAGRGWQLRSWLPPAPGLVIGDLALAYRYATGWGPLRLPVIPGKGPIRRQLGEPGPRPDFGARRSACSARADVLRKGLERRGVATSGHSRRSTDDGASPDHPFVHFCEGNGTWNATACGSTFSEKGIEQLQPKLLQEPTGPPSV